MISMSRVSRKRHSIQRQQIPDKIIYQNELKTQVQINRKNISKLIFYQSEDQQHSSQQKNKQKAINTVRPSAQTIDFRANKAKGQPFVADSQLLKPSLMKFSLEEDDYYKPIVQRVNNDSKNTIGIKSLPREKHVPKNSKNIERIIKQQQNEMKCLNQDIQKMEIGLTKDKITNITGQKIVAQIEYQIKLPQSKIITDIYFQLSQDQEEPKKQSTICIDNSNPEVQVKHQTPLPLSNFHQQTFVQLKTQQSEDKHNMAPFQLDFQMRRKSKYFEDILKDTKDFQDIVKLMYLPLLPETQHIFQVHVYSTIVDKTFEMWMDQGNKMKLLLRASKLFTFNRTIYQIVTYIEEKKQFCISCRIVSNLERNQFNIETIDFKNGETLIYGTIISNVTLRNSKSLVLYYPKVEGTGLPVKINKKDSKNLQSIFRDNQEATVSYIMTGKMKIEHKLALMKQLGFKSSQKSMQFRNENNEIKLMIGKKGSKRYSLVAGCGLTPIQLFSLAVINIQTS